MKNTLKRGRKSLPLETVSLYHFKWIRGRVNFFIPVVTGEGDKPPCNLFDRGCKIPLLQ